MPPRGGRGGGRGRGGFRGGYGGGGPSMDGGALMQPPTEVGQLYPVSFGLVLGLGDVFVGVGRVGLWLWLGGIGGG